MILSQKFVFRPARSASQNRCRFDYLRSTTLTESRAEGLDGAAGAVGAGAADRSGTESGPGGAGGGGSDSGGTIAALCKQQIS